MLQGAARLAHTEPIVLFSCRREAFCLFASYRYRHSHLYRHRHLPTVFLSQRGILHILSYSRSHISIYLTVPVDGWFNAFSDSRNRCRAFFVGLQGKHEWGVQERGGRAVIQSAPIRVVRMSDRRIVPSPKLRKSLRSPAPIRHSSPSFAHWLAKQRVNGSRADQRSIMEIRRRNLGGRASLDRGANRALRCFLQGAGLSHSTGRP